MMAAGPGERSSGVRRRCAAIRTGPRHQVNQPVFAAGCVHGDVAEHPAVRCLNPPRRHRVAGSCATGVDTYPRTGRKRGRSVRDLAVLAGACVDDHRGRRVVDDGRRRVVRGVRRVHRPAPDGRVVRAGDDKEPEERPHDQDGQGRHRHERHPRTRCGTRAPPPRPARWWWRPRRVRAPTERRRPAGWWWRPARGRTPDPRPHAGPRRQQMFRVTMRLTVPPGRMLRGRIHDTDTESRELLHSRALQVGWAPWGSNPQPAD